MTGHGRGVCETEGWNVTVECSSVNRKGVEVAVAVPRTAMFLEPKIRERVLKAVARGRINVSVQLERPEHNGPTPCLIDRTAARAALREMTDLQAELALPGEISLEMLLKSPGVLRNAAEEAPDPAGVWPAVEDALDQALGRMSAMRRKEGAHLVADLLKRLKHLESSAKAIRTRLPSVRRQRHAVLRARLEEAGVPLPSDDPSLARELAMLAERSDITEELTRLESHFEQCRTALAGETSAGRTLDYLAQEMFREFNTLGNKAGDAAISQRVVQSKAELDRIREQVANLE